MSALTDVSSPTRASRDPTVAILTLGCKLNQADSEALARMRRRYTSQQFLAAVELIRRRIPAVAISTDILVGFPGETEDEFRQTGALCREAAFAALHVFPYSRRSDTGTALIADSVPTSVKEERVQRMLALGRGLAAAFRRQQQGRTLPVLWEVRRDGDGCWSGLTDNYVRVYAASQSSLANRITEAYLGDLTDDGVWGQPILPED